MLSENQQNQQRALAQTQANLANQQNNNNKDNNYNGNGNGNNNGIAIVNQQGPTSIGFGNYNPQIMFKCRGTFVGHKAAVWALIVHGDKLYSGSGDASIKVWDCMVTFKNLETLQGHSGQVLCLAASGNFLFSGSHDKTIRAWSTRTLVGLGEVHNTMNNESDKSGCCISALLADSDVGHLNQDFEENQDNKKSTKNITGILYAGLYCKVIIFYIRNDEIQDGFEDPRDQQGYGLNSQYQQQVFQRGIHNRDFTNKSTGHIVRKSRSKSKPSRVRPHSTSRTSHKVHRMGTIEQEDVSYTNSRHRIDRNSSSATPIYPSHSQSAINNPKKPGSTGIDGVEYGLILDSFDGFIRDIKRQDDHLFIAAESQIKIFNVSENYQLYHKISCYHPGKPISYNHGQAIMHTYFSLFITKKFIIAGTNYNTIYIYDRRNFEIFRELRGHTGTVNNFTVLQVGNDPNRLRLFSASDDKALRVWNLDTMICTQSLIRHQASVTCLAVNKVGMIFSGSLDATVKVWQ